MTSIQSRLFIALVTLSALLWLFVAAWIYFVTQAKVEHVLDSRLVEAAKMVESLANNRTIDMHGMTQSSGPQTIEYEHQLSCQIWSLNGVLVGKSPSAPEQALSPKTSGFSVSVVDGQTWRSYAILDRTLGIRILVGDNIGVRQRLTNSVMKGIIVPALAILPLMALSIWRSLNWGLTPLRRAADDIGARDPGDFRPLGIDREPREIRPLIEALNSLFSRVGCAREREKNFVAFAAHELKTPLAGLKTQAQLMMLSDEPAMREQAISQIVLGVDRTSRLVRQLLDMATVEGFEQEIGAPSADAYHLLCLLYDDLRGLRGNAVSFKIDESIEGLTLLMSPDLFALAARNLLENALLHSPEGSVVHCWAEQSEGMAEVFIKDQGRGVDTRELPRITERFYRGRDKRAVGSGLGLSIAEAALAASASTLHLGNALGGGFLASMRMPARRGQTTPRSSHRERLRKHSGDAPEDGLQAAGPHGAHVQAGRIAPATD